ncbi:hypothetical protein [Legionella israelensis]|uniref:hypothetical protein n=1 Tax=Legionella israelensis TaxID=454 RepID=UPI000730EC7B|nr:hypothetical protein [Legionella israelensis]
MFSCRLDQYRFFFELDNHYLHDAMQNAQEVCKWNDFTDPAYGIGNVSIGKKKTTILELSQQCVLSDRPGYYD